MNPPPLVKLRDCVKLAKGKPPAQQPYYGAGSAWYLTPEYLRGAASCESAKPSANAVHVQEGDTILLWDGSNAGEVFLGRDGMLASTMTLVSPDNRFTPDYFFFALKQWEPYLKGQTSGSGIPHVDKEVLGKLEITEFAKPEQSKIAEVLSTVDRAIAQTEALIVKQQRIKTGLMQDLLTRGIDEHGQLRSESTHAFKDSPLGRIPVEWEVSLLDALAERGSGHTPSKQRPDYWNGGIKWISLADSSALDQVHINETEYEISDLGLRNSSAVRHPSGTVVLSRDAGVGKSAVMQTSMAVSQHFMAWHCGRRLHNYFLYYWLQHEKPRFEGIASGSTIVTIGLQFFKKYRIAHPIDPEEQIAIAKILLQSEETARHFKEALAKLRHLKTALMQDLLTGKVRVTPLLQKAKEAVTA